MEKNQITNYIKAVLNNMPTDWLTLTTHRLDIYNESLAKTEFIEQFEKLFEANNADKEALSELPTAFDYIRLGHPLSSILEWTIAGLHQVNTQNVITFSSQTTPILAILRKNLFANKKTLITYSGQMPTFFDADTIKSVYNYDFELQAVKGVNDLPDFDGSVIYVANQADLTHIELHAKIDFFISENEQFGSILIVNGTKNEDYISQIQHVRRRETIAMTPADCHTVLAEMVGVKPEKIMDLSADNKTKVLDAVKAITKANTPAIVGSSGLSIQYAIVMGLIDYALENYKGKDIRIVVPPNCYGGTNDQARRVAACIDNVSVMDLPVDGGNDMVKSIDTVLSQIAKDDAVPFIIAEIPTNPRVEVPNLENLRDVLAEKRQTQTGTTAVAPVFILDQTFCPNVQFLGEGEILSSVQTIAYVSGSKFPSGGKCTAGYCVANEKASYLMSKIEKHLILCDNEATDLQMAFLAEQLPSMLSRIESAYQNTRQFVNFIQDTLPGAKINFVSEELASQGFTPSVFSLDLPTKGDTPEAQEQYKRELNNRLINMMINEIPNESKYCVSYGQLKGCYWTIPATSTQGTTKEGDKDYIVRASLSGNMDLEQHKKVFKKFVEGI